MGSRDVKSIELDLQKSLHTALKRWIEDGEGSDLLVDYCYVGGNTVAHMAEAALLVLKAQNDHEEYVKENPDSFAPISQGAPA